MISFRGQQVSENSTQLTFGGHNGTGLVFDWSGSANDNPAKYQRYDEIGLVVGRHCIFKIDPMIIARSSSQQAINSGNQRKLWHTVESNGTIEVLDLLL